LGKINLLTPDAIIMSFYLGIAQIIIGIAAIVLILLQQRGGGIGILGGVSTQFYGTRRGLEKSLFIATFVLVALFIIISFWQLKVG